ncbi:conserved hypothetical protein [Streptomyces sp. SPB78]|uniref:GntR family transcriptional regulator n=1 Tax=Streptomyces sp. (strain SPB78) TaxID=591157 RepID=UPI0001B54A29|nr:GntR family transcriptional regulator [Streptomyces sp. SPB78]EFL04313.1 conserved hypothetical protein [Streptomyces sp. SPB78]
MPEVKRAAAPYQQVAQHFRDQILSGQLVGGDRVPSVRDIASEWSISKATADKALSALRSEGLIIAVTGVGSMVAERLPSVQTGGDRIKRMLTTGRATRPGERSEIISSGFAPATADAAKWLGIQEGEDAVRRRRRFVDDEGIAAVSTSWLPAIAAEAVPEILRTESIPGGTIGALLRATKRQAGRSDSTLSPRLADAEEAGWLELEQPVAVMIVQTRVCDEDGTPIEFGEDVIAPDRRYAVGEDLSLL